MALEQGNTVRGMTLMRMAHRDGDRRATLFIQEKIKEEKYLAKNSGLEDSNPKSSGQQNSLLSLNQ